MSEAELLRVEGPPVGKMSVGDKTIYRWPSQAITVQNGVVTKVVSASAGLSGSTVPASKQGGILPDSAGPRGPDFQTHWQTECQYIVETICSDLTGMYFYAATGDLPGHLPVRADAKEQANGGYLVTVTTAAGSDVVELPMTASIFAAETYQPLLATLQKKHGALMPVPAPDGLPMLETLCNPQADVIEGANQRLSAALGKSFSAADLHDQAALLLAAFTLRDHSGTFSLITAPLCRLSAHLAFARALRGADEPSPEGLVAAAALATLVYNQAESENRLSHIPESMTGIEDWKRVLAMRNVPDFHRVDRNRVTSPFIAVEQFRALREDVSRTASHALLDVLPPAEANLIDIGRIMTDGQFSVGEAHYIEDNSLGLELAEASMVLKLEGLPAANLDAVILRLNEPAGPCISAPGDVAVVHVIPPGLWADFLQRHLCNILFRDHYIFSSVWGLKEDADKFASDVETHFVELNLYPFVRRLSATTEPQYRHAQDECLILALHQPQNIPSQAWRAMSRKERFAPLYKPERRFYFDEWNSRSPPPGTAYDLPARFSFSSLMEQPDTLDRLERLRKVAPWNYHLLVVLGTKRYGDKPTGAQWVEVLHDVLPFSAGACERVAEASKDQPAEYEHWMSQACELNPVLSYAYAGYLVKAKRDDEAIMVYERAFDADDDAVHMASECRWAILYYESHGRSADATKLADRAAEVYSLAGLEAKARLLEVRKQYPGCVALYRQIEERYDRKNVLLAFMVRVQADDPNSPFAGEIQRESAKSLPGGLVPIPAQASTVPPQKGMLVSAENDETRRGGLKLNDVVVGLDGYQVTCFKDYAFIRSLRVEGPLKMLVWRDPAYVPVQADPPKRLFSLKFSDFPAPQP